MYPNYSTNLTDSEWKVIEKFLNDERKRKYSLRFIVDAIMYITKTGCQWRMLPTDFPKWQLVYYYFRQWSATGLTEEIHDSLVISVREKSGKKASPSVGLLDSQSVKTASVTQEKGCDGNKKIQGRKRFVVTDTLGLILGIVVCPANTGERAGGKQVLHTMKGKYPRLVKILVDQGFDGAPFAKVGQMLGWIIEVVAKVAGVSGFQVLPKRWIVERTFGWLGFQRRLVKDYEVKTDHSIAFTHWAMIRLMVRKL
jgi:putative transposase